MDSQKVDIIVFGATGYTGKYVVEELVNINKKFTWAIAGRNLQKLREVLDWVSVRTGHDVTSTPIIVTDCGDQDSLNAMARRGRVVINCCGPYKFYGEPVVKACVQNGVHQVDVSGELEFMETIRVGYHEEAEKKNVYIVSACGFDCIPTDMGVLYFINNFPGQVNSIECYVKISPGVDGALFNIGSWETVVHGFAYHQSVLLNRKYLSPSNCKLEPRLKERFIIHTSDVTPNSYNVPFSGADDVVVHRTQMFLHDEYKQRPVQFMSYFVVSSVAILFALIFVGIWLQILGRFSFGKRLLMRYPEFFSMGMISSKGPTEEQCASSSAHLKFKGEGWSKDIADKFVNKDEINVPINKQMVAEMSIRSPGYGFTAKAVVLSAFTILTESVKMPSKGGVYTAGAAFSSTSLFDTLMKNDVTLRISS